MSSVPVPVSAGAAEDLFSQFAESKEEAEIFKVLKELFDRDKIRMITDLEDDEIRLITQINLLAELKGLPVWSLAVTYYTEMLLSRKRKSRTEIIDAIKGYAERFRGLRGMFQQQGGQGGGGFR